MAFEGYNGAIEVDGDVLVIAHSGFIAKTGGIAAEPRRIPLPAVSDVGWHDASRTFNGWVTLGLGGNDAAQLTTTTAASEPDAVMFRWKDRDSFRSLYEWLVSVVEHNRSTGVDSSLIPYDVAEPSRQQRSRQQEAAQLVSEEREDIRSAVSRMERKLGGRRELTGLADRLHPGEAVRCIAQGTYERDQGIVVLTDQRLLFLFHGMMRQRQEDLPLRLITSVQTKTGVLHGELKVFLSGNTAVISGVVKADLEPLATALRQTLAAAHTATSIPTPPNAPSTKAPATANDPYEQLAKLATLRDQGVLTDDEFAAKKQQLLDRM